MRRGFSFSRRPLLPGQALVGRALLPTGRRQELNIARRQHAVSAAHYESGFEVLLTAGSFVLLGQIETQAIVMIALLALIFVALLLLLGMWLK